MFEDLLFVLQFLEKSSGTFCIQNELYNYLLHAESATHRLSPEFYREGIKAMNLISDEFENEQWAKPLIDKYKSSTKLKIISTHSLPRKELLNLWRDASTAGLPLSKRFLLKTFSATPPPKLDTLYVANQNI
ncbi:MAG: hypothetical protein LUD52_04240 [Opitutae bacterium]|nr:hypothetical protein [Opitutae bacterium]